MKEFQAQRAEEREKEANEIQQLKVPTRARCGDGEYSNI